MSEKDEKEYTVDELQRMMHDDYDLTSQPLNGTQPSPIEYHKPAYDEDLFDYFESYWHEGPLSDGPVLTKGSLRKKK